MKRFTVTILVGLLCLISTPTTPPPVLANTPSGTQFNLALTPYFARPYVLTPTTRVVTDTITFDGGTWLTVGVGSNSRTLRVTLTSPQGTVYTGTSPEAFTTADPSDPRTTSINYAFTIERPVSGLWTYRIEEPNTIAANRAGVVEVFSDSPVRAASFPVSDTVQQGTPALLGILVAENQTIRTSNTTITTTLRQATITGPATPVTFRDDGTNGDSVAGDGLFTAGVQPSSTGTYVVDATISGYATNGERFTRSTSATFRVVPTSASLSGTFTNRGIDTNGDGVFEQIGIAPTINVIAQGTYRVMVTLRANSGAVASADLTQALNPGLASPEVRFDAETLRRLLQVDGPYVVQEVLLERLDAPSHIADIRTELGSTNAFQLNQFQRPPLDIQGLRATGVDTNGNGKFDFLDVAIDVDVATGGSYQWSATLVSETYTIVAASTNATVPQGRSTITLRFDGQAIGRAGRNGPFEVRALLVYDQAQARSVAQQSEVGITQVFQANQFEGSATPTFQTVTVSTYAGQPGDSRFVDGIGTAARFNQPKRIAISSDGTFALMTDGYDVVRRINLTTGAVTTIANLPQRGNDEVGIAISPDRTYALLTRMFGCVVQRLDLQTNAVTTLAGQLGACPSPVVDGVGTQARFYRPRGVTFAPTGQYALIVDGYSIRRLDLQTNAVTTIIGAGDFAGPVDGVGTAARLGTPVGIAISADGTFALLTEDFYLHSIRRINLQTNQVTTIAGPTNIGVGYPSPNTGSTDGVGTAARFNRPNDVAISRDGRFALVSDTGNRTIRRIDLSTNAVITVAGKAGVTGTTDGAGTNAQFITPLGIALSPDDTFLLVSDMNGKTIRKLTSN